MAKTRAPKRPADYAKLADETELLLDGIRARKDIVAKQLNSMLKDVPERAAIMQSFVKFADVSAQEREITARFDRYVSLRDRSDKGDSPNAQ